MKIIFLGLVSMICYRNAFSQEVIKSTPEKIVKKDKDDHQKTKEKKSAFVAISDSVKIKDRHGRRKTKDFTAHTVIKEKKNKIKFKNKLDGSWMKEKNGVIRKSRNYGVKDSV